jgi:plastocyanin
MSTRSRMPASAVALLTAGVVAAGCGSSSGGSRQPMGAQSAATGAAPAAAPASGPAVASATVDLRSFKYKPVTIVVKKGGHVRWTNSDSAAHTATADDRSFDTQTIDIGKARTVTFTTAGTFPYHCDFHPFMKATVVVR